MTRIERPAACARGDAPFRRPPRWAAEPSATADFRLPVCARATARHTAGRPAGGRAEHDRPLTRAANNRPHPRGGSACECGLRPRGGRAPPAFAAPPRVEGFPRRSQSARLRAGGTSAPADSDPAEKELSARRNCGPRRASGGVCPPPRGPVAFRRQCTGTGRQAPSRCGPRRIPPRRPTNGCGPGDDPSLGPESPPPRPPPT